ncbi:uL15 family ribosomal protein [Candidatus Woesearchaeota archaeon]|nr:uL15 family ribosomal protein [Candidatus Woesearchaeota archaeon]
MVVHKRRKSVRMRGSKTHGGGSMKKRRGSGHKGGAGMSGTGKRADSKKPSIWKDADYFGKHGFHRHGAREKMQVINVRELDEKVDMLVARQAATKDAQGCSMDLGKAGYNKLLGSGKVTRKLNITVKYASQGAIEAVQQAGGKVTLKE